MAEYQGKADRMDILLGERGGGGRVSSGWVFLVS